MFIRTRNDKNHQLLRSVRTANGPRQRVIAAWTGERDPKAALLHSTVTLGIAEKRLADHIRQWRHPVYGVPHGKRLWYRLKVKQLESDIRQRRREIAQLEIALGYLATATPP